MNIRIVGAGLIGTSLALALKSAGESVEIDDIDQESRLLASDLLGNPQLKADADIVLVATPVSSIFSVIQGEFERNPRATFMDIGGLKSNLLHNVEEFPELSERFVSLHPMAGREISGPSSARADLFESRAVLITPTSTTSGDSLERAHGIVNSIGATGYEIKASEHDRIISAISHMPQLVSSLLAASLVGFTSDDLAFSGGGLRDITRLASSSAELWSDLFLENKTELLKSAQGLQALLENFITALEHNDRNSVLELMQRGNSGRALIPGKHGAKSRNYTFLPVVIDDRPGQLAKLFEECASAHVNVEDLSIEHSPGQETGLITLALSETDALKLKEHLVSAGWRVHSPLK